MRSQNYQLSTPEWICSALGVGVATLGCAFLLHFLDVEGVLGIALVTLMLPVMVGGFFAGIYIYHWIVYVCDVFAGIRDLYRRRRL